MHQQNRGFFMDKNQVRSSAKDDGSDEKMMNLVSYFHGSEYERKWRLYHVD